MICKVWGSIPKPRNWTSVPDAEGSDPLKANKIIF